MPLRDIHISGEVVPKGVVLDEVAETVVGKVAWLGLAVPPLSDQESENAL